MADRDGGATKEIQERIERQTKRINSLQSNAFQVANFYFAAQAVVFTALTGDSTSLVCRDLWFPLVLSLVPAFVNITALSVIGWNLVNAIGDRLKIIRELSTYQDHSNTLQPLPPTTQTLTMTVAPGATTTAPPQTRTLTTEAHMPPALPLYLPPTHTLTLKTAAVPETTTLPLQTLTTTATPMPLAVPGTMTTAPGTTTKAPTGPPRTRTLTTEAQLPPALPLYSPAAVPTGDLSLKVRHTICFCACMIIFAIFTIVLAVGSWWMLCREQNFVKHHDDDDAKCVKLLCDRGNCIILCRKSKG